MSETSRFTPIEWPAHARIALLPSNAPAPTQHQPPLPSRESLPRSPAWPAYPAGAALDDLTGMMGRVDALRSEIQGLMSNASLRLEDISPLLAAGIDYSAVPVPGSAAQLAVAGEGALPGWPGDGGAVRADAGVLAGMAPMVAVLHTKTRPKRVTMVRGDGAELPFLLKGREDLRLDERIMSMLRAINAAVLQSGAPARCQDARALRARVYDVIPLGNLFGLIGWVQGAQGLYSLFETHEAARLRTRALQQRRIEGAEEDGDEDGDEEEPRRKVNLMRPFYLRLAQALVEEGVMAPGATSLPPRTQWTPSALRKVVSELTRSSPRHVSPRCPSSACLSPPLLPCALSSHASLLQVEDDRSIFQASLPSPPDAALFPRAFAGVVEAAHDSEWESQRVLGAEWLFCAVHGRGVRAGLPHRPRGQAPR